MSLSISSARSTILASSAVLVTLLWFWLEQPEPTSFVPEKNIQLSPVRFGPGEWMTASVDEGKFSDLDLPQQLAITPDQQLLIDQTLHEVMDLFLLSEKEDNRGDRREVNTRALRQYLQGKLPPTAYQQALQILEHYLSYMDAHDQMLTVQTLPTPGSVLGERDVQRVLTWLEQRARLRQSLLGAHATLAWYEDEDEQLKQTLSYLRDAAVSGGSPKLARGMPDALASLGRSFQSRQR